MHPNQFIAIRCALVSSAFPTLSHLQSPQPVAACPQDIANVNAKNYQLWNHRRKCALLIGEKGKEAELDFTAEVGSHRQQLPSRDCEPCMPSAEAGLLPFLARQVLVDDAKNYHAWSHRQAIVTAFGAGNFAAAPVLPPFVAVARNDVCIHVFLSRSRPCPHLCPRARWTETPLWPCHRESASCVLARLHSTIGRGSRQLVPAAVAFV